VARLVEQHRRIVSVVMDEACRYGAPEKKQGLKKGKWWQRLACPVVFVPAC
jgi:hypothetical protein